MARQAPASLPGRLGSERKAEGQEQGEDACAQRLAIAPQRRGGDGRVVSTRDWARCSWRLGRCAPGAPAVLRARTLRRHDGGNARPSQDNRQGLRVPPRSSVESSMKTYVFTPSYETGILVTTSSCTPAVMTLAWGAKVRDQRCSIRDPFLSGRSWSRGLCVP